MKKKQVTGCVLLLSIWVLIFSVPVFSAEEKLDTDAGIQFYEGTGTTSSSTEPLANEPFPPNKPIIKPTGTLPLTGELLQPLMFLFLGWLCIAVTVGLYLSLKKNKKNDSAKED